MEIKKVLVHSCFQRKKGKFEFSKDTPLSPKKCRCRKYVTIAQAAAEVATGAAQYVVVIDKIVETDEVCNICGGQDNLKKSCLVCNHTGIVKQKKVFVVHGENIIRTVSPDGKRNTKTTKVKKSPTIEKAHIERAYVSGRKADQDRIEEYGELIRNSLLELGASYTKVTGSVREIIFLNKKEPTDNARAWWAQGCWIPARCTAAMTSARIRSGQTAWRPARGGTCSV